MEWNREVPLLEHPYKSCLKPELWHHADNIHPLWVLFSFVFFLFLSLQDWVCACCMKVWSESCLICVGERWGRVGWLLTHPTQDYCSAPAVKHSRPRLQVWRAHPGTLPSLSTCDQQDQAGAVRGFWASARVHFIRCTVWIYRFPRTKHIIGSQWIIQIYFFLKRHSKVTA